METPAATVLLFAALRDAAGVGRLAWPLPATVDEVCAGLVDRFGDRFAQRMAIAKVMVDGNVVAMDSSQPLHDGAEVALLPPFAGG